jgi:hypothetical protein
MAVEIWAFWKGGVIGAMWGFIIFGGLCQVLYTLLDAWHHAKDALRPAQTTNYNLAVETQAIRGTPVEAVRNATTTDDFAGMIEYRKNRQLPRGR